MKSWRNGLIALICLCFANWANAQGDSCILAEVITMNGTYMADGPATGGGCFTCSGATNADWYEFTAPANGKMTISSCADPNGIDTRLWVHSGNCGALTLVASNDDLNGCSPLTNFASEVSDVPVTNGTTYYIEWDDNWTPAAFEWAFTFTPNPAVDVGVVGFTQPQNSGCGLSNSVPVTVSVFNYGTDPISNIGIDLTLDAAPIASEVMPGPIPSGSSANYTFAATVDLSTPATYVIGAATTAAGDGDASNDAGSVTITNFNNPSGPIPIVEDFDSYADGTISFTDFDNLGTAPLNWEVNFGPTTSTATGPDDDVSGGGNYIYMETSSPAVANDQAILVSDCIDLSSATNPRLTFSYHMFGASIKSLNVEISVGGISTSLVGFGGPQQFGNNDPWRDTIIDLTAYVGNTVQLVFTGEVGDDGTGTIFNGDIALDEISITDPMPADLGVVSIDAPQSNCTLSNMEPVTVTIENFGSTAETGFDLSYVLGGTATASVTETYTDTIQPGTSTSYTFSTLADLSALGAYTVDSYTSLTGDTNTSNDSSSVAITSGGSILPIFENFDTYIDGTTVFPSLENDPNDDLEWEVNFGPTSSTATGPDGDVNGSGGYIYMETSGSLAGQSATICTGCINLSSATNPRLEFFYHMYGGSIDSLVVSVDDGVTITEELVLLGEQQTANADPWLPVEIDLTAYAGSIVQICFTGNVKPDVGGNLFNGDFALDNLIIREPPTCPEPADLIVSNITDVTAEVSWTPGGLALTTVIEYGPTGFTPGTGTTIPIASLPQALMGLTPQTIYDIYVTEVCGPSDLSLTIGPVIFETLCSPSPYPGNFFSNPIVAPSLPYADTSSTAACYSDDFGQLSASPDVYYSFTTDPCAASVTVSLCGSAYDTRLSIISPVDTMILFTNDDFCGLQSEITFPTSGSNTYYAVVEGFGAASVGDFILTITENISTGINGVAILGVNPSCPNVADGAIDISIDGGAMPFTYTWSNGASTGNINALPQGTYTITVTDNCGGFGTASLDLVDPAGLLLDAGMGGAICLGDSIELGGDPSASLGNPLPFYLENAFGYDAINAVFFKHDLDSPDTPTDIAPGLVGDYFAGDFGPDGFYALETTTMMLSKIDTATGVPTNIGTSTQNTGHTWTGLAWDGSTMHGLSTDGTNTQLYTIDLATAIATPTVASDKPLLIWLATDNFGAAYTMDIGTDSLYSIDLSTGATTGLGPIGFDANFAQDADFDPKTNTLYLAAYNNAIGTGELRTADVNNGNTTLIGAYPNGGEIAAFGIADLPIPTDPYIYQWTPSAGLDNDTIANPMASPSMTTEYVLAVTDACGVASTTSVLVEIIPPPMADAGADVPLCGATSTTLTATGGIIYSWNNGMTGATITVNPTVTTTYSVTVTDANCSAVDSVTVIVSTPVAATITVTDTVNLASTPADSYQWYFDNSPIAGATGQTWVAEENGVYWVETVDSIGCTTISNSIFITDIVSSIGGIPGIGSFQAYPNPTSQLLTIAIESLNTEELSLELIDMIGRVIHQEAISLNGNFQTTLDMTVLPSAVYLLRLKGEKGTLERRIVKAND